MHAGRYTVKKENAVLFACGNYFYTRYNSPEQDRNDFQPITQVLNNKNLF